MVRDDGEPGEIGGDAMPVSGLTADGLNEKVGRAAGVERLFSSSFTPPSNSPADNSIVEKGRLTLALG
jgi:hypothetical protein